MEPKNELKSGHMNPDKMFPADLGPTVTGSTSNLLSRQGHYVLPFTLCAYILMQVLAGINTVCIKERPYSPWVYKFYFAAGISFFTSASTQIAKIWQHWRHRGANNEFRGHIYVAAALIGVSSGTASLLTSEIDYGGICRDVLDVESPAAQWSEWLACVPLMTYLVVALEDKDALTLADYAIIFLMGFSVLSGFLMNLNIGEGGGIAWFVFGCLSLVASQLFVLHKKRVILPTTKLENGSEVVEVLTECRFRELAAGKKRQNLIVLIASIFPLFPVVYILGWMRIINRDEVAIAYLLVSISSKLLFVSSLLDAHVGLSDYLEASRSAEKRANDAQRDFLRFVFHELRIPLNTITMGIELMQGDTSSGRSANPWTEALRMMNGAAVFMNDMLNDVLQIHRIQEGAMVITKSAFIMQDIVRDSTQALQPLLDSRNLSIVVKISQSNTDLDSDNGSNGNGDQSEDHLLLGDQLLIERVFMYFMTHAAKAAPLGSQIKVDISKKFSMGSGSSRRSSNFRGVSVRRGGGAAPEPRFGSPVDQAAQSDDGIAQHVQDTLLNIVAVDGNSNMPRQSSTNSRTATTHPTRCTVTVTVTDSGPGLTIEEKNALLNPFGHTLPEQGAVQQEEQGRSTGLWLMIAQGVISTHGGKLIAQKNTFGFSIPFDVAPIVARKRVHRVGSVFGSPRSACSPDGRSAKSAGNEAISRVNSRDSLLKHTSEPHSPGLIILGMSRESPMSSPMSPSGRAFKPRRPPPRCIPCTPPRPTPSRPSRRPPYCLL